MNTILFTILALLVPEEELEGRSRIIPVLWGIVSDLLGIATYFVFFK